jgi:hypothetical protein
LVTGVYATGDLSNKRVRERFDGAYFHGTRALDPESIRRRGLLPLDAMLDEIWATLRKFAGERTDDEWAGFRASIEANGGQHDGELYRLKRGDRVHFGPHGELVREVFLDPAATSLHDYLGCPAIVQDIARCYADALRPRGPFLRGVSRRRSATRKALFPGPF